MLLDDLISQAKSINEIKMDEFVKYCPKKRVGIFGGTFDPIHNGHLAVVEFIREKYKLEKVIFIPSGNPPHKSGLLSSEQDRMNMVLLAAMRNSDFIVSDYELGSQGKTFTINTLRYLKDMLPSTELCFITGADAIVDIESWKNTKETFELATFIAATRPGISLLESQEKIEELREKYDATIHTLYVPALDISSTYIRNRLEKEKTIKYLLPNYVEQYIAFNKLYKKVGEGQDDQAE